jgi:hypothetical protein
VLTELGTKPANVRLSYADSCVDKCACCGSNFYFIFFISRYMTAMSLLRNADMYGSINTYYLYSFQPYERPSTVESKTTFSLTI